MQRALARLADDTFDVLVVGAGIYGAAIAWDATHRGLRVALVDRGDFGGATSANSAKTLHGGVRALQRGNLVELRRLVAERRALGRIAPHLVAPLPFLIATTRHWRQHPALLRVYFALYDLLAWDRNRGLDPAVHLPATRFLSRAECLVRHPLADPAEVTGGVLWHDGQMLNPDRLTFAFVASAAEAGAAVANHVEARAPLRNGDRVRGLVARDLLGGSSFDIQARLIVNATGPWAGKWIDQWLPGAGRRLVPGVVRAVNLVTRPIVGETAVAGEVEGRLLFAAPWRGVTIVGTGYVAHEDAPDRVRPTAAEIEGFLADVRRAFPRAALTLEDVELVHGGLLPAAGGASAIQPRTRTLLYDHARDGVPGLLTVVGARYTTARWTAERVVDRLFQRLGRPAPPCRTAEQPLLGGEIASLEAFLTEARRAGSLEPASLERLARTYGTRYRRVLAAIAARPGDERPLGATCPITRGEIRYAVREEMAARLADAILRRTEAGSAGHPGSDALVAAAAVMAEELGWPSARVEREIADLERLYQLPDT